MHEHSTQAHRLSKSPRFANFKRNSSSYNILQHESAEFKSKGNGIKTNYLYKDMLNKQDRSNQLKNIFYRIEQLTPSTKPIQVNNITPHTNPTELHRNRSALLPTMREFMHPVKEL